jgi:pyruvate kinase
VWPFFRTNSPNVKNTLTKYKGIRLVAPNMPDVFYHGSQENKMPKSKMGGARTKVVCTLGPASSSVPVIENLVRAGMDVARLNLSHGSHEEHTRLFRDVRSISASLNREVAILMDLPGPKYRTGAMKDGSAILKKGAKVTLTTRKIDGDSETIPINFPTLPQDVRVGRIILVDDGNLELKVVAIKNTEIETRVVEGGIITPGRGVVVPGVHVSEPFLTQVTLRNLEFAIRLKPDYIALSFVTDPGEVEQVREIVQANGLDIPLISKIERGEAIRNFDKILAASDGIMVARGDLGVEIPLKKVPVVQKEIIRKCNMSGKAVITATQMLESMVNSVRPTRAEVTDVANAILDGTDAIMLSAETSMGKYPIQSVKMMDQIAKETERHLPYEKMLMERGQWLKHQTDELISYNACYTAFRLKAAAIVAYTHSGSTARRVSKNRPSTPIIAITPNQPVARRLVLYWGVRAFHLPEPSSVDELFQKGAQLAKELGVARAGDLIVITGGLPLGVSGSTNLLKVQSVS